jgi:hypothetical protein
MQHKIVGILSLLILRKNKKCNGYIITVTEGVAATGAVTTEAAATGEAATGAANLEQQPQEEQYGSGSHASICRRSSMAAEAMLASAGAAVWQRKPC